MSYYQEKSRAYRMIDEMLSQGKDINLIYFKISTTFGFGKKIVDDRINMIEKIKQEMGG